MLEDRRRAIRATLKAIDDKLRAVQVRRGGALGRRGGGWA